MSLSFTVNQTASLMQASEEFWSIYERVRSLLDVPTGVEWTANDLMIFLTTLSLPEKAGPSWHIRDVKFTYASIAEHVGGVMESYGFLYGAAVVGTYKAFTDLTTYLARPKEERNFRDARSLRDAVTRGITFLNQLRSPV